MTWCNSKLHDEYHTNNWIKLPFFGPGYQIHESISVGSVWNVDLSPHKLPRYEWDPTKDQIHFIAALLAHAIVDVVFFNSHKGVWITSDALSSASNMYYCIHPSLNFSGDELCTATSINYLPTLNGLGLGAINSEKFELDTSHIYKCSHRPNKGSRSTLFLMLCFM